MTAHPKDSILKPLPVLKFKHVVGIPLAHYMCKMMAKTCTILLSFLALASPNLAGAGPAIVRQGAEAPVGRTFIDKQWDASDNTNFMVQVTHLVSLTKYVNGQISTQRTTRDEIARCCPTCVNLDGQH